MDRQTVSKALGKLKVKRKHALALAVVAVIAVGATAGGIFVARRGATQAAAETGKETKKDSVAKSETHTESHTVTAADGAEKTVTRTESKSVAKTEQKAEAAPGLFATYVQAFESFQEKLRELREADEENRRLKLENVNLRLKVENLVFDCRAREASTHTQETELKLSQETLSAVGRTLSSIQYKIPTHLMPQQLYTLGVSYFKAGEAEKAAVILTHLTGMADSDTFKTAKNYLMTGVAWYRLENYALADQYFDKVLNTTTTAETKPYMAQARLWRALAAEKTDQHSKSQYWMRELVDYHPHSTEAEWVNSTVTQRSKEAVRAMRKIAHE